MTKLFQGKIVAVIGLGVTGLATVRFLLKQGVKPVLMDTRLKVAGLDAIPAENRYALFLELLSLCAIPDGKPRHTFPGIAWRAPLMWWRKAAILSSSRLKNTHWPTLRVVTRPAVRSTLRCCEIAGALMANSCALCSM